MAFLVAFQQNKQLIGDKGLLPCQLYLQDIKRYFKGKVGLDALSYAPTLLWFLDGAAMDTALDCLALAGLALAAFVLLTGCANMLLMFLLWLLYLSLVNVGQIWWVLSPSALLFLFFFFFFLWWIFLLQFGFPVPICGCSSADHPWRNVG